MASLDDEDFDVDAELDAWLDKAAAEQGIDPKEMQAFEQNAILEWQKNPTPEGFEQLYNLHQGLIFGNPKAKRYLSSTTLPQEAVRSSLINGYVNALQGYNPDRGAQFKTYLQSQWTGRTGRYITKYTNVGRIPEERTGLINLYKDQNAALTERLGRPPSDSELADEMLMAAQDIADLRNKKITPKVVGSLRKEMREDWVTESAGGGVAGDRDSEVRRQIVFLHGSLNPEQQLVIEHTYPEFGKPVSDDDNEVARMTGLSPQKVRALKAQIKKKVERFYGG